MASKLRVTRTFAPGLFSVGRVLIHRKTGSDFWQATFKDGDRIGSAKSFRAVVRLAKRYEPLS